MGQHKTLLAVAYCGQDNQPGQQAQLETQQRRWGWLLSLCDAHQVQSWAKDDISPEVFQLLFRMRLNIEMDNGQTTYKDRTRTHNRPRKPTFISRNQPRKQPSQSHRWQSDLSLGTDSSRSQSASLPQLPTRQARSVTDGFGSPLLAQDPREKARVLPKQSHEHSTCWPLNP